MSARIEFDEGDVANIEKLAAVLNQAQLAAFLGCSERTLRQRMSENQDVRAAYEKGRAKAIADVANSLLQSALDGNITAQIFYLKTQAGWSDKGQEPISVDAWARMLRGALEAIEQTDGDDEAA